MPAPQSCRKSAWSSLRHNAALVGIALVMLQATAGRAAGQGSGGREAIRDMGGRYGFPSLSQSGRHITLESRYTTIMFETNSRKMYYNGLLIWLNGTVRGDKGNWTIDSADVEKVIDPLLRSGRALAGAGFATVVLDPGHGGDDTGAIGSRRRVYEKKVVLDIAKRVREKLRGSGINVRLTRETDINLSLAARSARAKEWRADLFVSIHCNAAHDSRAEGIEAYVLPAAGFSSTAGNMNKQSFSGNRHDRANMLLAYYVHKELIERTGGADRGIRRARFDVLRDAPCPAILVECGFVSNRAEEEKILTIAYRDSVAEGIAAGIREYVRKARDSAVMSAMAVHD